MKVHVRHDINYEHLQILMSNPNKSYENYQSFRHYNHQGIINKNIYLKSSLKWNRYKRTQSDFIHKNIFTWGKSTKKTKLHWISFLKR
jgi:hypothetical protein